MTATDGVMRDPIDGVPCTNGSTAVRQMTLEGPGKQVFEFRDDGVTFSSCFDGGSMAAVTRLSSDEFHVTIPEDAAINGVSTGYTTWFYFEVVIASLMATAERPESSGDAGSKSKTPVKTGSTRELLLVLTNMNNQRGLFSNGYTLMSCVMDMASRANEQLSGDDVEQFFENERKWMRLPTPIDIQKYTYKTGTSCSNNACDGDAADGNTKRVDATPVRQKSETKMKIAFTHHVQFTQERVRFAFCYPYTYTKIQRQLNGFDAKHASGAIYYHRDVLTYSLGGLPIELLTISSHDGLLEDHEPLLPALFPETGRERARSFDPAKKRTVFITARVHPGETPASFMLDGMLRLLLHPTDEHAACLRRYFVFKIVPVLNPDGVCQGYYRTDTRGVNLNRVYESPQLSSEPAIFATKELLLETVKRYGESRARENVVYLDLHAHANHRGCFVYGNSLLPETHERKSSPSDLERQVQTQVYAKLVSLHCPFFDYGACSFDAENMNRRDARDNNNATTSREGSSRVALFRATDLTYVYTIECNYNEGRRRLEGSTKQGSQRARTDSTTQSADRVQRHAAPLGGRLFIKYAPAEWIDVGIGSLLALVDLFQLAPARASSPSAIAESPYRTLDGVKKSILSDLKAAELLGKDTSHTPAPPTKPQGSTRNILVKKSPQAAEVPERSTKSSSSSSRSIVSKY